MLESCKEFRKIIIRSSISTILAGALAISMLAIPTTASAQDKYILEGHATLYGRAIDLWLHPGGLLPFHGEISHGQAGDQVWLETQFGEVLTDKILIASGSTFANTSEVNGISSNYLTRVRACGEVSGSVACTDAR